MLKCFSESETGIDQNSIGRHPANKQRINALVEKGLHLGKHIAIERVVLHRTGLALHMH